MESFMRLFEPCGFRPEAMCPAFGLAEATLLVSSSSPLELPTVRELDADALEQARILPASAASKSVRKIVGCGPLVCDTRVVIVNPESLKECRSDEIGEIWISDPSVAGGYWNKPEETKRTFHAQLADSGDGPFLRTGDLGFMMDGELFIAGRLKDLVIIRGSNFYPQDIEWTAQRSHPKLELADGAAFSVMVDGDERLVLVQEIKRKENQAQDFVPVAEAIIQAVAEEYDIRSYAVALIRGGSISKTSSGKIQRRACRASFLDGSLNPLFVWKEGESRVPVGKTE
jgi:acyl-CoA synthetase (AMP-forming)/AMP-acid ligase II